MATQLEQLGKHTVIVADTGDINAIKQFTPEDATTNPSLLLKAAVDPQYKALVDEAIEYARAKYPGDEAKAVELAMDKMAVNFGVEISKIVPGVVSTEVDARLSFDTAATVDKARQLIKLYEEAGVGKDRILIKVATTWEGIRAVEILEKEGVRCNMTLLFSMAQAVGAAEAGAHLISPFVGRITDWYKAKTGTENYPVEEDPGVLSVRRIYAYFKKAGYKTIVMGASFRSTGQVLGLTGCDKLTIAPALLEKLRASSEPVEVALTADTKSDDENLQFDENAFRWSMNEDAMATEKLAEGIRKFAVDIVKLETTVRERLAAN